MNKEQNELWEDFRCHCPRSQCEDGYVIECVDSNNLEDECMFETCPLQKRFKKIYNIE